MGYVGIYTHVVDDATPRSVTSPARGAGAGLNKPRPYSSARLSRRSGRHAMPPISGAGVPACPLCPLVDANAAVYNDGRRGFPRAARQHGGSDTLGDHLKTLDLHWTLNL